MNTYFHGRTLATRHIHLRKVDDYDFNFQPGIKEEKIRSIIESDFYENATNIVFVGNPGTGKHTWQ